MISSLILMSNFAPMPLEITTERLALRPWDPSDAEILRELWSERDHRSMHRIGDDGRPTVGEFRQRLRASRSAAAKDGIALLPIIRQQEGDFIGYCGLIIGHASLDEPEIAYELFRRVHGNGYATEAARAVVQAAAQTGRSRLWSTVRDWNTPSLRVLDKLGFQRTSKITPDAHRGDSVWLTRQLTPKDHSGSHDRRK